jgi:hypothetical protein
VAPARLPIRRRRRPREQEGKRISTGGNEETRLKVRFLPGSPLTTEDSTTSRDAPRRVPNLSTLLLASEVEPCDRRVQRTRHQVHIPLERLQVLMPRGPLHLLHGQSVAIAFRGDPYGRYGGRSLHTRSHGEAFLAIMQNRIRFGLLLLDEPESALSPQRQLTLLAQMWMRVAAGTSQFIIATHSPVLLTFPGAQILSFGGDALHPMSLEDTSHFQVTKGILQNPAVYWKYLRETEAADDQPIDTEARQLKIQRRRRSNASDVGSPIFRHSPSNWLARKNQPPRLRPSASPSRGRFLPGSRIDSKALARFLRLSLINAGDGMTVA